MESPTTARRTARPQNTSVTGLQHDTQVAQMNGVTLLTDTTDATGRCHDPGGGGIEIVDVTRMREAVEPREVHLVRFPGFTHTNTVDGRRPWIVYSSSSDFADRNWIDVVNMRSCFGDSGRWTAQRRARCRPEVYRIQLQDAAGPSSATRRPVSSSPVRPPATTSPTTTAGSTARPSTPR